MRQKRSNVYKANLSILAVIIMAVVTLASVFIYRALIDRTFKLDTGGTQFYAHHIAMVTESHSDPFWKNVWLAAKDEGGKKDAYVEWIGNSLTEQYPLATLLQMAISAKVDGILIQPDGSDEVKELIASAIESGIPVITVMSDATGSGRQGFVGYNSYDLGQLYGQQVRAAMSPVAGEYHVVLLFGSDVSENAQNIVYSSIKESLEGTSATLDVVNIDNSNVFSAEEAIRELVVTQPALIADAATPPQLGKTYGPDILICLNATNTVCAYQAVVDHNKVGQIQILGYYDSDEILTAVEKRVIQATVAVDAARVGASSVDALMEYLELGRTSDFTPVGLTLVTAGNVGEYRTLIAGTEAGE
ncbi:MAG: sugar ABC transporter substrate-binding protein [Clostridiales bacterium]|nr:sugar ABC transporter substrate-binding protein [Clostridiales bacterium]